MPIHCPSCSTVRRECWRGGTSKQHRCEACRLLQRTVILLLQPYTILYYQCDQIIGFTLKSIEIWGFWYHGKSKTRHGIHFMAEPLFTKNASSPRGSNSGGIHIPSGQMRGEEVHEMTMNDHEGGGFLNWPRGQVDWFLDPERLCVRDL